MLRQTIFREYDIRGVAETDLPTEGVVGLGRAIGTYLRRHAGPNLTLGRDVRLSGPRLHDALLEGLLDSGCDVTLLGPIPTPLLYYSVFHLGADGGAMITGSHNPPEYNGFKTVAGKSTIYGPAIQEVYRVLSQGDFDQGCGHVIEADIVTPYVDEVAKQFKFANDVRVVIDCGNGAAGPVMHRLLRKLHLDAVEMFFEPDGRFPNHHPDPTVEENLAALQRKVKEYNADLGIAFDGDGDRIGAVDDQGHVVWGDQLMIVFGREILKRKPGATFIGEVKCSQVMYDELKRLGGRPIMYKTGHSLIKAKMKEEHAELAGEMSGHMFFADRYYGFDDALYAACRLMEIVAASGKPLSAQLKGLPRMVVTPELRFDCPDEAKFDIVARVKEHFRARREIIEVDGVRVLFEKGWGLVRASNTQPILVLRFEAETPELLRQYRDEVESVVRASV